MKEQSMPHFLSIRFHDWAEFIVDTLSHTIAPPS